MTCGVRPASPAGRGHDRDRRARVEIDDAPDDAIDIHQAGEVDDAEIDTKRSISGSRGRLWNLKRHSQVELPFAVEKVSLPFDTLHACLRSVFQRIMTDAANKLPDFIVLAHASIVSEPPTM